MTRCSKSERTYAEQPWAGLLPAASGTTSVLLNLSAGRPFGVCRCVGQCADNGGAFELLQIERASFQNPEALELARAARSHRRFEELERASDWEDRRGAKSPLSPQPCPLARATKRRRIGRLLCPPVQLIGRANGENPISRGLNDEDDANCHRTIHPSM